MQQISTQIVINVPNHLVVVEKAEYEALKDELLIGVYWNMQDLEKRINKKEVWIKDNILLNPKFKEKLDVHNGGFVYYPKRSGERWSFQANKMAKFLDDNFHKIFK